MEVAEIRGASSRLLNRAHQAEEAATDRHDTKQHEESSGKKGRTKSDDDESRSTT